MAVRAGASRPFVRCATALLALAAGLLWASLSEAQTTLVRSPWAITINGIDRGEVVIARDGADVWIPVEAIARSGIAQVGGQQKDLFGQRHVLLSSLAPSITFAFDEARLVLVVTVEAGLLPPSALDVRFGHPEGIEYVRSPTAYVNYAAIWNNVLGDSYLGQAGVSLRGASAYSDFSWDQTGAFYRGLSTLTIDSRAKRLRFQAGDVYGRSSLLGNAPLVAGLSFGRDYSTDPYYESYSTPSFRGAADLPSQLDVYVNDQLARRFDVPPGPYAVGRLPVTNGLGRVRLVVRDQTGRVQEFRAGYYLVTQTLIKGEQDFGYTAGVERHDGERVTYDDTITATATHRVGVTNWLTLGYHAEGSTTSLNGGPTLETRLWRLGELQSAVAFSQADNHDRGWAASANYSFTSRFWSVSAFGRYMSPFYSDIGITSKANKDPWNVDINGSVPIGHAASLNVEVAREEVVNVDLSASQLRLTRPAGQLALPPAGPPIRVKRATLNFTLRIFSRAQLNANVSRERREGTEMPYWFGYAGLSFTLGSRVSLNVTGQSYNNQASANVDLNRSLADGPGYGYRITGSFYGDSSDKGTAQVEGRSQRFWAGARTEQSQDGTSSTTLAVAGGVAWAGGTVRLSAPIDNSFAIVRLPDSPGVQVLLNNQSMGKTDRHGTLMIPNLSPYYGNLISINSADLPLDVNIERVSRVIAPPYRGAASVRFPITRLRAWVGTIRIVAPDGAVVPAYGTLAVGGPPALAESPLGADGAFYIDGIPPGSYAATVTYAGGTCTFTIVLIDSGRPMTQLGALECRHGGEQ